MTMVYGALHYGQVASEHQIKLALNQCHQEDKKKGSMHKKDDKHKPWH
jgi:hypothetical protein